MADAPTDAEETDEDLGPTTPEPPRRVPFAVAVTASLLGLVAMALLIGAVLTLTSDSYYDSVGEATAEGLATAGLAMGAAVVAAVAWSMVRNGNTVGPMVVGGLVLLTGLIFLVSAVAADSDTAGLRIGVLALVLGLGVLLVPLFGQGPAYLAARRVWADAERDWLQDLTTPAQPQGQWPGQYPPPQQWGVPAPQPGYPPQYQYPPQPPGQPWPGPPPPQYQAWPAAPTAWSAPPAQQPPPGQSVPPQPVPTSPAPPAVSQQAPTEQIPPAPQEKPQP
ncbi:hypothetical protein ACFQFC_29435 [Amorphoplanes digitatis]|uniref:Uncharacterized protein n=1 Tax=Actinoplanes digitatis TaxID=1868 RepID=A0A7W7HT20_9ACTN|nr:hypothetical protein [Actinoplanes digitatis]MBB4760272.1 hypothetical protein [Actinoplanes digitatis]GID98125.1 hypothetical protein Adi01nite_75370 [Actinoplanes digitatis]